MKKNFTSLIIKFIILGIPLYIIMLYTWLFPMNYMPIEYSMWAEEKDYTENGPFADTLIIGDSRAKSSLIPAMLTSDDESVYNMAIGGATPIEMYYALQRYLDNHAAPSKAIIIFAPYHFCDIDNWGQTLTYNYLSVDQLLKVYTKAIQYNELDNLSAGSFTDVVSYKLRLPNKYMSSLYNAKLFGRYQENLTKYTSVNQDLGYTVFGEEDGCDWLNYETHHECFDYSRLVMYYYESLLKLCADNNIYMVIPQAPVNRASMDVTSPQFFEEFESTMKPIYQKYEDMGLCISTTSVPVYDNEFYGDANHLNKKGAIKFTEDFSQNNWD